jgi:AcrR family transcriptional regulator
MTRAIGNMGWAARETGLSDLVGYESRLGTLLRRAPDVVICMYDLNLHSARTIADIMGVHSAAIVGGVLRAMAGPAELPARERLLAAASELFQESGVQATGVDSIIKEAGVAKATFYRHFPSKDDLVVAWLRDSRTRWFDGVRARLETQGGDPVEKIRSFFDGVAEWLDDGDYRGCPYLNTASEITEPTHPAQPVIREYLQEIEDYLASLIAAAGYRDSRALAAVLQTLTAGSISLAVARRSGAAVVSARDAAMSLLAGAERD